ncbi:MAG: tryptophan synthase alpha chain [Marinoscillum sp.]|jgi:tryptophan synthase alpha chain
MNRIDSVFEGDHSPLLNIYFTAGHPALEDTLAIAKSLDEAGADLIEIGLPFSDPIADGPTIQSSSHEALENGMSIAKLLDQLKGLRPQVKAPVLLMGYINPVLQYGFEKFCAKCQEVGVDGLILPDLPMYEYEELYAETLEKYGLYNVFLITPQTSVDRIRKIDQLSKGFIYMVSSASTTGAKSGISDQQVAYFERIAALNLKNRRLIGFGISDHESFTKASKYADGAIVGSAFIKQLEKDKSPAAIAAFVSSIKSPKS